MDFIAGQSKTNPKAIAFTRKTGSIYDLSALVKKVGSGFTLNQLSDFLVSALTYYCYL
jgi:hypothetical protein